MIGMRRTNRACSRLTGLWLMVTVMATLLAAAVPAHAQRERPSREETNAGFAGMLVDAVPEQQVQLLAEVLGVPTDRLGELHSIHMAYQEKLDALKLRSNVIVAEYDLGGLSSDPEGSPIPAEERAAAFDRGLALVETEVIRGSNQARESMLAEVVGLVAEPDQDRLRVYRAIASSTRQGSFGPAFIDLLQQLAYARHRQREYAVLVPEAARQPWEVAVHFIGQARAHREASGAAGAQPSDAGAQPPDAATQSLADAVDGYVSWLGSLSSTLPKLPRWDEMRSPEAFAAGQRKRFAARDEGTRQHAEAIAQAIQLDLGATLGPECGPEPGMMAALEWRRDVRAAGATHFFGESELDRAHAFLKRLSLGEETLAVVNLMHQSAIVRLEAADVGVESALAATNRKGWLTPPGTPGAAHVDAACQARIKVLDEELDAIGAVLAGTEFEDRWRKWVIDLREKRDGPWDVH